MSHLRDDLRSVATWLDAQRDEIVDDAMNRLIERVPEYFDDADPSLAAQARDATSVVLRDLAAGIGDGLTLPDPTASSVEEAKIAARTGVPWVVFQRGCNVLLSRWWELLYTEIGTWDLPAERRQRLVLVVSRYLFDYFDHAATELERVHAAERDRVMRIRDLRRVTLIRQMLDDIPVDEEDLGYPVAGTHVGAIAWGRDPDGAIGAMTARIGGATLAAPAPTGASIWSWHSAQGLDETAHSALRGLAVPAGTQVAIGDLATGVTGFRQTHREAMLAFRVAMGTDRAVTLYRDVQLEALVTNDIRLAKEFSARQLGQLNGADERSRALRETLRAYFATGHNGAAAAAALGVHERTVSYRLATIEKQIGCSILSRKDELALALRLHDLYARNGTAAVNGLSPH
ncbi:PucR family transcriptional regulator [Capillimicrobium parvum]|nr:helix-turn-helix domain-containing protein [Capillimicrobium parvum]